MTLAQLNAMPEGRLRSELGRCCGSARWVEEIAHRRPFADTAALETAAAEVWRVPQEAYLSSRSKQQNGGMGGARMWIAFSSSFERTAMDVRAQHI